MVGKKSLIVKYRLARSVHRQKTSRLGWRPVRLLPDGTADPVEYHGTAHISAYAVADGLISIPIGVGEIPAGSFVDVRLI